MVFACDLCDATYPVRHSLSNHKRLKHGDAAQFNCTKCTYATTKKENLDQHVRSVHEKIKVTCDICNKEFSKTPNLNKHKRQKHPETLQTKRKATEYLETQPKRIKITQPESNDDTNKINGFECKICKQEFKELYNLNKHIKNVHEEKKLKCQNCSYATNDAPSIQRHTESCTKIKREEDVVEHI